eukprot:jgi/Pico_ML_1/54808/g671.t1
MADGRSRRMELAKERASLPVFASRGSLVDLMREHDTLVVVGETGSGKTTQIPQFLVEAKLAWPGKGVAITQPRHKLSNGVVVLAVKAQVSFVYAAHELGYGHHFPAEHPSPSRRTQRLAFSGLLSLPLRSFELLGRVCQLLQRLVRSVFRA